MTKDELAGFIMTVDDAEEYFNRVIEAEKTMGPLSREERITILKTLGEPLTLGELMDRMAGKRVMIVRDKKEQ